MRAAARRLAAAIVGAGAAPLPPAPRVSAATACLSSEANEAYYLSKATEAYYASLRRREKYKK